MREIGARRLGRPMNTYEIDPEAKTRIEILKRLWFLFAEECRMLPGEDARATNEFIADLFVEVEKLAHEKRISSPFRKTAGFRSGLLDTTSRPGWTLWP
jgi:hypothetical protein